MSRGGIETSSIPPMVHYTQSVFCLQEGLLGILIIFSAYRAAPSFLQLSSEDFHRFEAYLTAVVVSVCSSEKRNEPGAKALMPDHFPTGRGRRKGKMPKKMPHSAKNAVQKALVPNCRPPKSRAGRSFSAL